MTGINPPTCYKYHEVPFEGRSEWRSGIFMRTLIPRPSRRLLRYPQEFGSVRGRDYRESDNATT